MDETEEMPRRVIRLYSVEFAEINNIAMLAFFSGVLTTTAVTAAFVAAATADSSGYAIAALAGCGALGYAWCLWLAKSRIIRENHFDVPLD